MIDHQRASDENIQEPERASVVNEGRKAGDVACGGTLDSVSSNQAAPNGIAQASDDGLQDDNYRTNLMGD